MEKRLLIILIEENKFYNIYGDDGLYSSIILSSLPVEKYTRLNHDQYSTNNPSHLEHGLLIFRSELIENTYITNLRHFRALILPRLIINNNFLIASSSACIVSFSMYLFVPIVIMVSELSTIKAICFFLSGIGDF